MSRLALLLVAAAGTAVAVTAVFWTGDHVPPARWTQEPTGPHLPPQSSGPPPEAIQQASSGEGPLPVGGPAPAIDAAGWVNAGNSFELEFEGRVTVVDVWADW